jgi:hypothetical protein
MRFTHFQALALVVVIHLLVPLALALWTWRRSYTSVTGWGLQVLVLALYTVFVFLLGSWVFASFYLRYAIVVLSIVAAIRSFLKIGGIPSFVEAGFWGWIGRGAAVLVSIVLIYLIVGAIRSHIYDEPSVNLSLPFKNGVYAVFEGGNGRASFLMNYHYGSSTHSRSRINRSMKYAVDLTKLSMWGTDANGILPRQNERYVVFNEAVYSPCDGEVSDVVDQWPNEIPWSGQAPYNVGNHILIKSGNFYVLMGHLQKGSIMVKVGDRVKKGDPLAKVGNSGWTSQPHLHIQAMRIAKESFWRGEGLPIILDGKNPVKNTLFFK